MSWELLPPWSSSALQEQKSPEGNIAHACVAGRPSIIGEGGGGKGAHGGPCGHPGRTEKGARDFFCWGDRTLPVSLFKNHCPCTDSFHYLSIWFFGVFQRTKQDTPVFLRPSGHRNHCCPENKDGLLRLASPQQSINRNQRTQTATPDQIRPYNHVETELQESKVQRCVLKCQMYFKGLGFPFSPAFRIVSDRNTRGLLSYSSNSPNFSLKSSIYYICQEKKRKRKHQAFKSHHKHLGFFFFFCL